LPSLTLLTGVVIDVVDERAGCAESPVLTTIRSKEKLLMELQEKFPPDTDSPQPSARVLRTGKSSCYGK